MVLSIRVIGVWVAHPFGLDHVVRLCATIKTLRRQLQIHPWMSLPHLLISHIFRLLSTNHPLPNPLIPEHIFLLLLVIIPPKHYLLIIIVEKRFMHIASLLIHVRLHCVLVNIRVLNVRVRAGLKDMCRDFLVLLNAGNFVFWGTGVVLSGLKAQDLVGQ